MAVPIKLKNALWTAVGAENEPAVRFVDVAASGEWAWAVAETGGLYVLKPGESAFVHHASVPKSFIRVASASDGNAVALTSDSRLWITADHGETWTIPEVGGTAELVDVAAGSIDVHAGGYPGGEIFTVDANGRAYSLHIQIHKPDPLLPVTYEAWYSLDQLPINAKLARITARLGEQYALDRSGLLIQIHANGSLPIFAAPAATDVGVAPDGIVWLVDTAGLGWRWNPSTDAWFDAQGDATAIAAAPNDSMWIVGADGKLYNRGGRSFGFWNVGLRARPESSKGQDWCAFVDQLGADSAAGVQSLVDFYTKSPPALSPTLENLVQGGPLPALWQEYAQRVQEGGATTILLGQNWPDTSTGLPEGTIGPLLALSICAVLGLDVYLIIPVIMTQRKVVPKAYMYLPFNSDATKQGFKTFLGAFVEDVNTLFATLGIGKTFEDVIKYVTIGGEVDFFLTDTPQPIVPGYPVPALPSTWDSWDNWIEFYEDAGQYLRSIVPRVKIGSLMTRAGARNNFYVGDKPRGDPDNSHVRRLNSTSDYFAFTTYPPNKIKSPPEAEIPPWFTQMLTMAGEKPVVIQEIGWPTYDDATRSRLQAAWPEHGPCPASFYTTEDPTCAPIGECWQERAVKVAFEQWSSAKLRIPLVIWFTAYEQHVEGDGCSCFPAWEKLIEDAGEHCTTTCNPCVDPSCHMCSGGELIDFLGQEPTERDKRFFGSDGLIQSDGTPKPAWNALSSLTGALRVPRGA